MTILPGSASRDPPLSALAQTPESKPLIMKALVYFEGRQPACDGSIVQGGNDLLNLFGSLLRSVLPLIKRAAFALGKRALANGMRDHSRRR